MYLGGVSCWGEVWPPVSLFILEKVMGKQLPTPPRFSCVVFSIEDQGTSCRQGQKYQKCNLIEIREIILHSILTAMHKCKLKIAGTETLKRVYISAGITVRWNLTIENTWHFWSLRKMWNYHAINNWGLKLESYANSLK